MSGLKLDEPSLHEMLAEEGSRNERTNDPACEGGDEHDGQHGISRNRRECGHIFCGHTLRLDLLEEGVAHSPYGQGASAQAQAEHRIGEGVSPEALEFGSCSDRLRYHATYEHEDDDEGREHARHEVDEGCDDPHDEHSAYLLHFSAHEHVRGSRYKGDQRWHKHPECRMKSSQKHADEVEHEVNRGEDTDVDEIAPAKSLLLLAAFRLHRR